MKEICLSELEPLTAMEVSFGDWLKAKRLELGLTQDELADRVGQGLSHVAIGDWERGRRHPRRHNLNDLAAALAGPNASPEALAKMLREVKAAAAGIDLQEIVREPDEEYLKDAIVAYEGTDPTLNGFKGFLLANAAAREILPEEDYIPEVDGPREAPSP